MMHSPAGFKKGAVSIQQAAFQKEKAREVVAA